MVEEGAQGTIHCLKKFHKEKMQQGLFGFERVASNATTRRPEFLADEVELMVCPSVSVLDDNKQTVFEVGVARLTSHRLVWMSDANETAFALQHKLVKTIESHMSGIIGLRTPQIKVIMTDGSVVRVNFGAAGRDQMLELWNTALKRRVWEAKQVEKVRFVCCVRRFLTCFRRRRFALTVLAFLGCFARRKSDRFPRPSL